MSPIHGDLVLHRLVARWPIRVEVAASGVVVALLVSLFLGYYAPARYRDEAVRARREQVVGTAEMIALSVGVGLRLDAPATVAAAITWARRDQALDYLSVIDSSNAVFAAFNPGALAFNPRSIPGDSIVERDGRLFAMVPIRFGDEQLGRLVIGVSLAPLKARIEQQRRLGLLVSAGVLSVGVLLSFFLAGVMTRPIRALREAAERVAGGGYDVTIPDPSSRNEIGALSRAFAVMLERIRSQLSTLETQARELAAARDTAVEATSAKSAFLATMSHEIRTPMNGVLGMLQLLRQEPLTSEQKEFANIAYSSGESLLTLINDILDFSKIEARKLELENVEFNLDETLDDVMQCVGEQASHKGLELVCVARHDVPTTVRGDPGRLRQVLINLAGNAVKFTPAGDVIISVSVGSRDDAGFLLRFEVADTGIGLTDEERSRLFRPFSQRSASTTRSYGGTGLGLSISRELVTLMGGEIYAHSEVGSGSTFGFTARFGASEATSSAGSRKLAGATILLVDEHRVRRRATQLLLGIHGARCFATASVTEAEQVASRVEHEGNRIDAAIINLRIGVSDALLLGDRIRCAASLPPRRVLVAGSLKDSSRARKASDARGFSLLTNRFSSRHLLTRVSTLLSSGEAPPTAPAAATGPVAGDSLAQARRGGRRVLVAEDNMVNERVVKEFLRRLDVDVTVVPNGERAVQAVRDGAFDLVLMDCHMPVMDGFQATTALRELGFTTERLPIIALTASAMATDRERCVTAGMDGFLSKPLRAADLSATLDRWLAPSPECPGTPVRVTPASMSRQETPFDLSQLTSLVGDDPSKVDEFFTLFLENSQELIANIDTALADRDVSSLRRAAHALKGSAASMGMQEIASLARDIERAATGHEWELASTGRRELTEAFARTHTAIKEYREYALAS